MSQSRFLKKAIKAKGWSDRGDELAEESGVHITLVRRYLDGDVEVGLKNAPRIARALDVSIEELLYGSAA